MTYLDLKGNLKTEGSFNIAAAKVQVAEHAEAPAAAK